MPPRPLLHGNYGRCWGRTSWKAEYTANCSLDKSGIVAFRSPGNGGSARRGVPQKSRIWRILRDNSTEIDASLSHPGDWRRRISSRCLIGEQNVVVGQRVQLRKRVVDSSPSPSPLLKRRSVHQGYNRRESGSLDSCPLASICGYVFFRLAKSSSSLKRRFFPKRNVEKRRGSAALQVRKVSRDRASRKIRVIRRQFRSTALLLIR